MKMKRLIAVVSLSFTFGAVAGPYIPRSGNPAPVNHPTAYSESKDRQPAAESIGLLRLPAEIASVQNMEDGTRIYTMADGDTLQDFEEGVSFQSMAEGGGVWYLQGKIHRADGPAIEWGNGNQEWYLNGEKLTQAEFNTWRDLQDEKAVDARLDPFAIIPSDILALHDLEDGSRVYNLLSGDFIRLYSDGVTVETLSNGDKTWYRNGWLHREDGPAVERADGIKRWYLNQEEVSEKNFNAWLALRAEDPVEAKRQMPMPPAPG